MFSAKKKGNPGRVIRRTVPGHNGIGQVHINYKPRKKRLFPYGLVLYIFALVFAFCAWAVSKPELRIHAVMPLMRWTLISMEKMWFRRTFGPIVLGNLDGTPYEAKIKSINDTVEVESVDWLGSIFGQGYVHAYFRTFQLEILRRAAKGELAEILGANALPFDVMSRSLNFYGLALSDIARLSNHSNNVLLAYSAGVNTFLNENHPLPLEMIYIKLNHSLIADWAPADSLAILRLISVLSSSGGEGELALAYLNLTFGEDATNEMKQILSYDSGISIT